MLGAGLGGVVGGNVGLDVGMPDGALVGAMVGVAVGEGTGALEGAGDVGATETVGAGDVFVSKTDGRSIDSGELASPAVVLTASSSAPVKHASTETKTSTTVGAHDPPAVPNPNGSSARTCRRDERHTIVMMPS